MEKGTETRKKRLPFKETFKQACSGDDECIAKISRDGISPLLFITQIQERSIPYTVAEVSVMVHFTAGSLRLRTPSPTTKVYTKDASEVILSFFRFWETARKVMDDAEIKAWLAIPHPKLGGSPPLDLFGLSAGINVVIAQLPKAVLVPAQ